MTFDEVARIDAAARAAHLDRSAYIRRVLKGRAVRFYPMEMLLAEAIALFSTARTVSQMRSIGSTRCWIGCAS